MAPTTSQAYNNACHEHLLGEVYRLVRENKLSSTNAKKVIKEMTAKIKAGKYVPPPELLIKWAGREEA